MSDNRYGRPLVKTRRNSDGKNTFLIVFFPWKKSVSMKVKKYASEKVGVNIVFIDVSQATRSTIVEDLKQIVWITLNYYTLYYNNYIQYSCLITLIQGGPQKCIHFLKVI